MQQSEALQNGGKRGSDLEKTASKISTGCNECGVCVRSCAFLQVYGTPKHIADQLLTGDGMGRLTAFECSLCNLCGAICPEHLSPVEMFLDMRRDAQQAGEVDKKKHATLLNYEKRGNSPLFSWYGLPERCDTVFFPGCAFTGTRPKTAWALIVYLRKQIPDIGVVLDCCHKPSHDQGQQEYFLKKFGEVNRHLQDHGVHRVVVACPNCFKVFKKYGEGLEIISVYELIVEYGLPSTPEVEEQCMIHDPCPLRNEAQIQSAIRNLTTAKGVTFDEMQKKPSRTLCCGEGGGVGFVRPEFAKRWGKLRADQSAGKNIVTYCAGCANFLSRYTTVWHVLDLVFFPVEVTRGQLKGVRAPFTYLHRLIYKKKLRHLLNVEDARRTP